MKTTIFKACYATFICLILIMTVASTASAASPIEISSAAGHPLEEKYAPHGTIVIAETNGQVLYENKSDIKWPPASMSKLMAAYLVYQAMDEKKFNLKTTVEVNDKFYGISQLPMLSNNKFRIGAKYTVDELMQIMLTPSSNAATFMLSSLVEKDDSDFVDRMNETAKKLGMKNTHFYNPGGPPNNLLLQYKPKRYQEDDDNISSARDYAILCQHLVSEYPQILKYTSKVNVTIKKGTPDEETFGTYNHSLEGAKMSYRGVDGLKTGSSDTAGFNTAITAKRNHFRIIEVMMGVEDWYDPPAEFNRNVMANDIMDVVFKNYQYKKVLSKGFHKIGEQEIYVHDDLYDVVKNGVKGKLVYENNKVHYEYERKFVSTHYKPAAVTYEDYSKYWWRTFIDKHFMTIISLTLMSIIMGILLIAYWMMHQKRTRARRRNIQRLRKKR